MNSTIRLVALVAGLVLMLHGTPSWGQLVNGNGSDVNRNTAGGTGALDSLAPSGMACGLSACDNTAFGRDALTANTTGVSNTATGSAALANNTTGGNNTANGFEALKSNTTGGGNTASGVDALKANDTGNQNTASGVGALQANTTGDQNTASGGFALQGNTTGSGNTASGFQALFASNGSNNTATGFQALLFSDGNNNTASGSEALLNNTTGSHNSALGHKALHNNTAGLKNTAVGRAALFHSTGSQNIAIGFQAGTTLTTGNNNIYLGNPGNGDESLTMRLGNIQTSTFIAGIGTTPIVANSATVEIDTATGQLGVAGGSSARFKRDIAPMGTRSEKVLDLRPVTFAYRDDARGLTHYGLVAEEVEKVYPELVTHTAAGEAQTVRYQELIPMLLNELQRQRQTLQSQEQALQSQQQALQRQQQELADLRALVGQGRGTASLAR